MGEVYERSWERARLTTGKVVLATSRHCNRCLRTPYYYSQDLTTYNVYKKSKYIGAWDCLTTSRRCNRCLRTPYYHTQDLTTNNVYKKVNILVHGTVSPLVVTATVVSGPSIIILYPEFNHI